MDLRYHDKISGLFLIKLLLFIIITSPPDLHLRSPPARPTSPRLSAVTGGVSGNSRLDAGSKISSMVVPIVRMVESSPFTQVRVRSNPEKFSGPCLKIFNHTLIENFWSICMNRGSGRYREINFGVRSESSSLLSPKQAFLSLFTYFSPSGIRSALQLSPIELFLEPDLYRIPPNGAQYAVFKKDISPFFAN